MKKCGEHSTAPMIDGNREIVEQRQSRIAVKSASAIYFFFDFRTVVKRPWTNHRCLQPICAPRTRQGPRTWSWVVSGGHVRPGLRHADPTPFLVKYLAIVVSLPPFTVILVPLFFKGYRAEIFEHQSADEKPLCEP